MAITYLIINDTRRIISLACIRLYHSVSLFCNSYQRNMKKLLLCFLLFAFHFSLLHAQDTIALANGQKIAAKVMNITYEVLYSVPPDTVRSFVNKDDVTYIRFKDGSLYTIDHSDTIGFKPTFYLVASGQFTIPAFNSYAYRDENNMYEGYALNSITYSVAGGVNLYRGWGITGMYAYVPVNYYASYYLNYASGIFNNAAFPNDISIGGNYNFTNYGYMLGITKASDYKFGDLGFRIMAGYYITHIPAMQGTVSTTYGYNNPGTETYTLYSTAATQTNFVSDFGVYGDIKIVKHILLHTSADVLVSRMTVNGNYSLADNATGQTISSGAYSNSGSPGYHRADLINIAAGLGYLF